MNKEKMISEFPDMPDEIRDRIGNEVIRQLKNASSTSGHPKKPKSFRRYAAGFAAAAAMLALCLTVPQLTRNRGTALVSDTTAPISDTTATDDFSSGESVKVARNEPKATNSFTLASCGYNTMQPGDIMVSREALNGMLRFEMAPECSSTFTGCMFSVRGENISKVSISIDKNELYSADPMKDLTNAELSELCKELTPESALNEDYMCTYEDAGAKYAHNVFHVFRLGSSAEEAYNPERFYGLYVSKETGQSIYDLDPNDTLQNEFHAIIDTFDGAVLSVTVTYNDGTTDSASFTLHSGKIRLNLPDKEVLDKMMAEGESIENLTEIDGIEFANQLYEFAEEGEPYIYGILAEPINTDNDAVSEKTIETETTDAETASEETTDVESASEESDKTDATDAESTFKETVDAESTDVDSASEEPADIEATVAVPASEE